MEEAMGDLNKEIIEIAREAIRLEIKGRNFFRLAAEVTQSDLGKKMFEKLANDEIEHLKVFGEMFTEATGGVEWKQFVRGEEKETSAIIEGLKERMSGAGKEKGAGDLEAIRIGMELERKAIDFFSGLASASISSEAKEIAEKIREQEEGHYDLLQAQYDSVHKSGFWFDVAEFRLDGEY
jgi:rubrerythrin